MKAINVWGPSINPFDSYGKLAVRLGEGLRSQSLYTNVVGLGGEYLKHPDPIVPVLGGFLLGYPTLYPYFNPLARLGTKIALTMFESTKLPNYWAHNLNLCEAVIVTSKFLVDIFKEAGVKKPIYAFPLGVDEKFSYKERDFSANLNILFVHDGTARKGWAYAVGGFINAFGSDSRYNLTIKCKKGQFDSRFEYPNIHVIEEEYTEEQMLQLYYDNHIMLTPTHGEGFGLLPREFAATGGISLATNWGGTADDIDKWGYSIRASEEPAWRGHKKHEGLGNWAKPDHTHISETLKYLSDNRDEMIRKSIVFSSWVKENYCWEIFAKQCLAIYEAYS